MKYVCTFVIFVSIFCLNVSAEEQNTGQAIQIMAPVNHTFQLQVNELKQILEVANIKDRYVVVVSIAGAFRQGKSFLMNFFIKYLDAQYKKHNASDWLGETTNNSRLNGFKWRGGRKPETIGIWMWSDIFTHDFPNGDKIAIILLDTQGIFDYRSSVHDCTAIFALSMMLSSVQCYNLMHNIREDDLQHLQLFTEYGRLAMEQMNEKPFQKLLFIVRDWSYESEIPYGNGHRLIDEVLAENSDQTIEMQELRQKIAMSFHEIGGFLLPTPGNIVIYSDSVNFTGDVQQVSPQFKKFVKELTPALFAPENLIIKQINGEKIRARDVSQYLQAYTNIFNGNALPKPKSILMATAETSNSIFCDDCLRHYSDKMEQTLEAVDSYMTENELIELHEKTKNETLVQFLEKPTLGGNKFRNTFQDKIKNGTEQRFLLIKGHNERKLKDFIERANLHNDRIGSELFASVQRRILDEIESSSPELSYSKLYDMLQSAVQDALSDFVTRKMGDDDISRGRREQLRIDLDHLKDTLTKTLESNTQTVQSYSDLMQKALIENPYFDHSDFLKLHQNSKTTAIEQFQSQHNGDNKLSSVVQRKIEANIEQKMPPLEAANEAKRRDFLKRANLHSETVSRELKASFENRVRAGIGGSFLSDHDFVNLFLNMKSTILQEFASRKMGDDELSTQAHQFYRKELEGSIDNLRIVLKQANEAHRPPREPSNWVQFRDSIRRGLGIIH